MSTELSECCGAHAESNIESGYGQCSDCHEPARVHERKIKTAKHNPGCKFFHALTAAQAYLGKEKV
jgi:hypothetical protein